MSEAALWNAMRVHCPLKMARVTDRLVDGIPDVNYTGRNGVAGWIELKYIRARDNSKIKFRPTQPIWLMDWAKAGGRAWVFLKHEVLDEYWLIKARGDVQWTKEIQLPLVDERQILINNRWKGKMDWPELARLLTTIPM